MPPKTPMHQCTLSTTTISRHQNVHPFASQLIYGTTPFANQLKCFFCKLFPILTKLIDHHSPKTPIPKSPIDTNSQCLQP